MNTPRKHSNIEHCYFLLTLAFISKLRNNFDNMLMYALRSRMYMRTDVVFIFIGDYLKATEQRNRKNRYRIIENYECAIPTSSAAILKQLNYNISQKNIDIMDTINSCNEILLRNEHHYYMIHVNILLGNLIREVTIDQNNNIIVRIEINNSIEYHKISRIIKNKPNIKSNIEYYSNAINIYRKNDIKIKNPRTIKILDLLIWNNINLVDNCIIGIKADYYRYIDNLYNYCYQKKKYILSYIILLIGIKHNNMYSLYKLILFYANSDKNEYINLIENINVITRENLNKTIIENFKSDYYYILEHISILRDSKENRRLSRIFLLITEYTNNYKDDNKYDRLISKIGDMYQAHNIGLFQQY